MSQTTKPNILFLFPDQHRGDWMPYSAEVFAKLQMEAPPIAMPNVQRLMENGTSFYRCISSSPLCAPARACLASGFRYEGCRVPDNNDDYPVDLPSFYNLLKNSGYSVGGVGKFDLHKKALYWGPEGWVDDLGRIGFTYGIDSEGKWDGVTADERRKPGEGPRGPYFKYLHDNGLAGVYLADMAKRQGKQNKGYTGASDLPDEAYGDTWIGANGVDMLRAFPAGKPWFLQVNFSGPHEPWDITQSMKARWENVNFAKPERSSPELNKANNAIRQNYAAMLENIDTQIGRLIAEVERRGELENTYIFYASDHGDMLGDLDQYAKQRPDRGSVGIPLVCAGNGIRQGKCLGTLVELHDLAATFLELAGLCSGGWNESVSLMPVLTGKTEKHRRTAHSALKSWTADYDRQYKTVCENGILIAKYDYINDPWERRNLL